MQVVVATPWYMVIKLHRTLIESTYASTQQQLLQLKCLFNCCTNPILDVHGFERGVGDGGCDIDGCARKKKV